MYRYDNKTQLDLFSSRSGFENSLNKDNRWIVLSTLLDWDSLVKVYGKQLSLGKGSGSKDARVVIGAIIIKHIEGKDDRGTIEMIQENPYMQYFLGLDRFTHAAVFDPS